MTYSIKLTPFTAALMDGAARAAGCSVEALLAGTICSWQGHARRATTTPVLEETPEHRAALPHVEAPAAAPAPRKSAPTTGLLELFGGEEDADPTAADTDPIIHP